MFASVFNKKTEEENMGKAKRLRKELEEADAIVIGAGAGLSASAGFIYTGERFRKYFRILRKNTIFRICIPADFILMKRWRNTGHSGAGIST